MRPWVRDALVGLSLANLCFIAVWDELLALTRNRYLLDISTADLVALMLNVLLLGDAFACAAVYAQRLPPPWPGRLLRAAFLAVLLLPITRVFRDLDPLLLETFLARLADPAPRALPARELAPLVPVLVFAMWPAASARIAQRVLLFFFPFVLVLFGRGLWTLATDDLTTRYADKPTAAALPVPPGGPSPRLVILLFDELDQRLAFTERPAGLALPAFDRLRAEGLFATAALRAGSRTAIAVPAMLAGRAVDTATHDQPDELLVKFADTTATVPWSAAPNLFSWARERGLNTAVVGWYHPYCRVLHEMLTRCSWRPHAEAVSRDRADLGARLLAQLRSLSPWDARRRHLEDYRAIVAQAGAAVTDTTLGVVLVHLNVPHNPVIYDRESGEFALHNGDPEGYLDNLVLADRTLAELRAAMEAAGLWERTTLLVVSDHSRRAGRRDPHVPLLVRLPGAPRPLVYTRPFVTTLVGPLARDLLVRRVRTPVEVARWLDARR